MINLYIEPSTSIIVDEKFNLDSIGFKYSNDSIIMYKDRFEIPFFKYKDAIFELREEYKDFTEYVRTDSILTFSIKDTTFIYESLIDKNFIPNVFDLGIADCRYEIKKIDDNSYVTRKQSLIDTTYQEIYYYDKNFRIFKFINSYKGNVCIYVLEK
jgi:hypothetical protein